jgi:hypothetical protein
VARNLRSLGSRNAPSLVYSTIEVQLPSPASEAPATRPIWPGRPELLYKQYLAEKEAWLTAHLDVRLANYRTARGLEVYSVR